MNITATFDTKAAGLQIVEKVSVVDTSTSPGGLSMKLADFYLATTFPDDSDFSRDQTIYGLMSGLQRHSRLSMRSSA